MTPFAPMPSPIPSPTHPGPVEQARLEQAFYERHANEEGVLGGLPRAALLPLAAQLVLAVIGVAVFLR